MARAIVRITFIAVLVVAAAVVWQEPKGAEASGIIEGDAGSDHSCLLNASGGVECWGYNDYGQVGDGTESFGRATPTQVTGLAGGVAAISAGGHHTCAVTTSGGVKCWGGNYAGQLGDGTMASSTVPVDVAGLASGIVGVSAGGGHTCALTTSASIKCWGYNYFGQLGNATTAGTDMCGGYSCSMTPVDVCADMACTSLLTNVATLSVGEFHTCAVTASGGAKCWGYNNATKLGNGTATDSSIPTDVMALTSGVVTISAGDHHTCALTDSGGVKCWGYSVQGKLGNGTDPGPDPCFNMTEVACYNTPVDVPNLSSGVTAISAGYSHTCAIAASTVNCWGFNDYGQLGSGTTATLGSPNQVTGLGSNVIAISSGGRHTCSVSTDNAVQCWGNNGPGTLGNGLLPSAGCYCITTPVYVHGLGPKGDRDADGCASDRELVTGPGTQLAGGNRDPANPWDYFNPTRDRLNRVDDILAVVDQYFIDDGDVSYTPATDRTLAGPNLWNTGPPNGLQRVDDIVNALNQYFHDCG